MKHTLKWVICGVLIGVVCTVSIDLIASPRQNRLRYGSRVLIPGQVVAKDCSVATQLCSIYIMFEAQGVRFRQWFNEKELIPQ